MGRGDILHSNPFGVYRYSPVSVSNGGVERELRAMGCLFLLEKEETSVVRIGISPRSVTELSVWRQLSCPVVVGLLGGALR